MREGDEPGPPCEAEAGKLMERHGDRSRSDHQRDECRDERAPEAHRRILDVHEIEALHLHCASKLPERAEARPWLSPETRHVDPEIA